MAKTKALRAIGKLVGALLVEERARRGMSRRRFLSGAAAASGAALLGGLGSAAAGCGGGPTAAAPTPARRGGPVVVVGAGIGGLVCAHRLRQAGAEVLVLEAGKRVGGRLYSDAKTFGPSQVCELGGELIDTGHKTIHALAKELGLALDDVKPDASKLTPTYHFGGRAYSSAEMLELLRPAANAMAKDLDGLDLADVPYESGPRAKALDAQSIDAWLKAHEMDPVARELLRVAFLTELGLDAEELSCIVMMQMFALEADHFELFGESDERYRVRGGNDQLPLGLARGLSDRIRTEARLEALRRLPDGRLSLSIDGPGERELVAEQVVLALPFTLLRSVKLDGSLGLSALKQRSIAELAYGTNAKLMLGFKSRFWEGQGRSGELYGDGAYQTAWDTSRPQPGDTGILTVYTGGRAGVGIGEGTPESARDRMLDALEAPFPGAREAHDGRLARFHWPSSPLALGSYSTWKVGQLTSFGGVEASIEGKNLHFAGEHTSLEAQGFMEGAAESGERAAREVLEALG